MLYCRHPRSNQRNPPLTFRLQSVRQSGLMLDHIHASQNERNQNRLCLEKHCMLPVRNVPDLWHFETDPDPWIRTLGYGSGSGSWYIRQWLFFTKLFCSSFCRYINNSLQSRVPDPWHLAGYELPDLKSREVACRIVSSLTLHLEHRALPRKPQYSQGCGCLSLRPRPLPLDGVDMRAASGMHGFPCSSIQP